MPYKDPERQREAQKRYYEAKKAKYLSQSRAQRQENIQKLNTLKEANPCVDCKVSYPYYVMHFDHIGTAEKAGNVSTMLRNFGWGKVLKEIQKCELVCANCHAIRTWKRIQGVKV
jgi:hypothetical protein